MVRVQIEFIGFFVNKFNSKIDYFIIADDILYNSWSSRHFMDWKKSEHHSLYSEFANLRPKFTVTFQYENVFGCFKYF